jgi:hypothetical protein
MADFFKGLSGGFQTGLQFGQQMRQRRMEDELAQAYAKPETYTDYTPEQTREIQRLQETGAYDVQAVPGAEGTAPTLRYTPRQGLELGQGEMPAAPTEIAPGQVQRYGGRTTAGQFNPTELRGLQMQEAARVLGSYGDAKGAAALQAQAEEQAYQARIRPLQEEQMKRQGLLTEGQIKTMNKAQERETKLEGVDADVAQWQTNRLIDPNTNEARQPTMDDNIAALQYRATALQKAGLAKEATDSLKDYQSFAVNQITLDEKQRNSQLGAVAAAIAAGDLNPAVAFYDRYVLDGAKVTGMKTDPKTGAITVSRVRDDGGELPDKVIKGGANELLAALNSFRDPMSLYNFSQNEFKNNLDLRKTVSAERTADAAVSLSNARTAGLTRDADTLAKLDRIDQQLEAIPPGEMSGPVARGLIMQRNAIVAGSTKQVAVGAAARPALSEAEVTTRAEKYVSTRQKNPDTGKVYTLDEAIDKVRGTPPAPGTPAAAKASLDEALGSGDPFAPAPAAPAQSNTGLQTAPATVRNAQVAPNPYVDARGRPLANAPAGAPSMASTAIPAAATAIESAVGTQAAATRYLQAKIARNEPLTPTDRARAVQLGLIR